MQINFTRKQLDFLIKEANKQQTTIEEYLHQLVEIQMDVEADLTGDMWSDDVLDQTADLSDYRSL